MSGLKVLMPAVFLGLLAVCGCGRKEDAGGSGAWNGFVEELEARKSASEYAREYGFKESGINVPGVSEERRKVEEEADKNAGAEAVLVRNVRLSLSSYISGIEERINRLSSPELYLSLIGANDKGEAENILSEICRASKGDIEELERMLSGIKTYGLGAGGSLGWEYSAASSCMERLLKANRDIIGYAKYARENCQKADFPDNAERLHALMSAESGKIKIAIGMKAR